MSTVLTCTSDQTIPQVPVQAPAQAQLPHLAQAQPAQPAQLPQPQAFVPVLVRQPALGLFKGTHTISKKIEIRQGTKE